MSSDIAAVLAGRATWALGRCDGFALAAWLGDRAVDHVIGDPPYDDHTHENMRSNRADAGDESDIDFAPLPPVASFLPALLTCSRRWTILFCSGVMLGDYMHAAGGWRVPGGDDGCFVRDGIWHRVNPTPQKTGDRPGQGCESLAIMHRPGGKMRWNAHGRQGFWEGPIAPSRKGRHPTKKPDWLMEALVRDFTDPGDVVLDPTCGEGTTGEACLKLGRRFIGCEIDPKYYAMALDRLRRADARPRQVDFTSAPIRAAKQEALINLSAKP